MSRMPVSKWFGLPLLIYVRGSFMCIAVCAIVVLVGWREEEARTPLVRRLEAAGAGDLSRASVNSIQQWFQQHEDLAFQTKGIVNEPRHRVGGRRIGVTPRKRACAAAFNTAFYHKY